MSANSKDRCDVLIGGGGHVGLTLALALRRAAPGLAVTLVDATPPEAAARDGRASAIAAAGRRMLDQLGVWAEIEGSAQPINEMVITDSRTRDRVRPVFLTFPGTSEAGEPFAHMVMNGDDGRGAAERRERRGRGDRRARLDRGFRRRIRTE